MATSSRLTTPRRNGSLPEVPAKGTRPTSPRYLQRAAANKAAAYSEPSSSSQSSNRVNVAVRIRPFNRADGSNPEAILRLESTGEILVKPKGRDRERSFFYDQVFSQTSRQEEVYEKIGRPLLEEGYNGFNVCLFAYGQTASGKTFSMQGDGGDLEGILPRFARDMLNLQQDKMEEEGTLIIKISMSYIEIYNEKVRDLLKVYRKGEDPPSLELHEDPKDKRVYVQDLTPHTVTSLKRIQQLIELGNSQRQTSETNMNELSSRSHSIIQFHVSQTYDPPSVEKNNLQSTMTMVDLAGSERNSKTGATGDRFTESKAINQSLLMLGRALNAFSEGDKPSYVPLRDSKLTRLLSDCFGGNAKTWMLATVSPSAYNIQETMSTLEYAANAKFITNTAHVNKMQRMLEMKELREENEILHGMMDDMKRVADELRAELAAERRRNDEREAELSNMNDQIRARQDHEVSDVERRTLEASMRKEISRLQAELAAMKNAVQQNMRVSRNPDVAMYIGRAKVSLRNIIEQTSNFMTMPLLADDNMDIRPQPQLIVNIYPVDHKGCSTLENNQPKKTVKELLGTRVDFVVHIIRAKGLPKKYSHCVYCKYVYKWAEKDSYKTNDVRDNTDPEWDFKKRFAFSKMNQGLVEYFMSDNVITFEVIGEAKPQAESCEGCLD